MADAPTPAPAPAPSDADTLAWVRRRQQLRERWMAAGVADESLVQATQDVDLVLALLARHAPLLFLTAAPVEPVA